QSSGHPPVLMLSSVLTCTSFGSKCVRCTCCARNRRSLKGRAKRAAISARVQSWRGWPAAHAVLRVSISTASDCVITASWMAVLPSRRTRPCPASDRLLVGGSLGYLCGYDGSGQGWRRTGTDNHHRG